MLVVLAGASGLIGTAFKTALREDGHDLRVLVRRDTRAPGEVRWWPGERELAPGVLSGVDAVVNLGGVSLGVKRWTQGYKREVLESRLRTTNTLVDAILAAGEQGPTALLSASAVGYYGDTGDEIVDESHPAGNGFLADVCRKWEAAAARADGDTRVVVLRTGLVLSRRGGLLRWLRPIVKAGLGGKLGSGRQFQPWIALPDHIDAARFLLTADVRGAVNLTGPAPVRQEDFVAEMGRILHRPTVLPAPGFAMRLALGDFADECVLVGQRAMPAVLETAGFEFSYPTLSAALRWALTG
jgi:uncharacterized protein (TIGR01777 family)